MLILHGLLHIVGAGLGEAVEVDVGLGPGVSVEVGGGVSDGSRVSVGTGVTVSVGTTGVSVGGVGGDGVSLGAGVEVIVASFGVPVGAGEGLGGIVMAPVGNGGNVTVNWTVGSVVAVAGGVVGVVVWRGAALTAVGGTARPSITPAQKRQSKVTMIAARVTWAIGFTGYNESTCASVRRACLPAPYRLAADGRFFVIL